MVIFWVVLLCSIGCMLDENTVCVVRAEVRSRGQWKFYIGTGNGSGHRDWPVSHGIRSVAGAICIPQRKMSSI
jgi:hypothetical protein